MIEGVRKRAFIDYLRDIDVIRENAVILNGYIGDMRNRDVIDSIAYDILLQLRPRHRVFAAVLAEHRLRFVEGVSLAASEVFGSEQLSIYQSKTGATREVDNSARYGFFSMCPDLQHIRLLPASYQSLKNDIHRVLPSTVKAWASDFKDATHIFRHLYCSYKFKKGVDLSALSVSLGHVDECSVSSYVHAYPGAL